MTQVQDGMEKAQNKILGIVTLKDLFERLVKLELKDADHHLYSVVSSDHFRPSASTLR